MIRCTLIIVVMIRCAVITVVMIRYIDHRRNDEFITLISNRFIIKQTTFATVSDDDKLVSKMLSFFFKNLKFIIFISPDKSINIYLLFLSSSFCYLCIFASPNHQIVPSFSSSLNDSHTRSLSNCLII